MSTIKCGNCGEAYIFEKCEEGKSIKCSFCREPITFTTPREVATINPQQRIKQQAFTQMALQAESDPANKCLFYVSLGMITMSNNAWENAVVYLEKAKAENPASAEIYYYLSVAMMGGKRPGLQKKANITSILDNLNCAIAFDPLQGKYYYLKALIIRNFYIDQGMAYSENFRDALDMALAFGVTEEEKDEALNLIHMSKPAGF